jgi:hypothetical protein
MRWNLRTALVTTIAAFAASATQAQLTSPQVGWKAELSTLAHGVSGTVTIVDEDTIQIDDFTYDGGGIVVKFYLGQQDTRASFLSGLAIGSDLKGHAFNGSQQPLVVDLPPGQTLEGWHAISVWCVTAGANFGSGTFGATSTVVPGDYNVDGVVDAADYVTWRDGLDTAYMPDHYETWRRNFGAVSANADSAGGSLSLASVPETASWILMTGLVVLGVFARRSFSLCSVFQRQYGN